MALYFFDIHDGTDLVRDEIGLEFQSIVAARDAAIAGLADLAKQAIPGATRKRLSIVVRDDAGHQIVVASLWFELHPPPAKPKVRTRDTS